jgi:acyl-CoA synthetase (AMP-forming)/AMP-acid ligase II
MSTLHSIIDNGAKRWPNRIALIDVDSPGGRKQLTYRELWTGVVTLSTQLRRLGLKRGDRVAILCGNSWEYVTAFLGISAAGMISVPMNVRLLEDDLVHMVRDAGARLLIAQEALLRDRPTLEGASELGVAVTRETAPSDRRRFEDLLTGAAEDPVDVSAEDVASLLYTSGTTGLPKGAMLSHVSWTRVAEYVCEYLRYRGDEVTIHTAALTHGSGFLLLPTFAVGGTNLVCGKFDPERVLHLVATAGVTNGFFVPTMIQMLLDAPETDVRERWRLRNLYYAGSPIDPGTLRAAMVRFGPVLIQSFAQTEAPMFLTVLDQGEHRRIMSGEASHLIRAAGRVVDGVQVRIVDEDDRELPVGEVGEVVASAPHVMNGYWNRPEATSETLRGGWLHTGDVGRFDADGYLYIVDRKKDMIISGGANVYAREVEQVLLGLEGVKEAAVIGLPHPKWGEMVTAILVSAGSEQIDEVTLDRYCRANIADYRRPKRYIWVDELPRNAYGKVLKRALRTRFAASGER